MMFTMLNEINLLQCQKPQGAFYCFPNITDLKISSFNLQNELLEKIGVATVAGTSFGKYGEGFLRLSCANSDSLIEEAINRISKYVNNHLKN